LQPVSKKSDAEERERPDETLRRAQEIMENDPQLGRYVAMLWLDEKGYVATDGKPENKQNTRK